MVNRAATSLRMAANALLRSQTYLGRPVPSFAHQTGSPEGHHGHGPSARATRLSDVEVRSTICRQRSRVLRTEVSEPTAPVLTQESGPTRFPVNRGRSPDCLIQRICGVSFWRGDVKRKHFSLRPRSRFLTSKPRACSGNTLRRSKVSIAHATKEDSVWLCLVPSVSERLMVLSLRLEADCLVGLSEGAYGAL